jgi:hypothetical protein
MMMIEDDKVDAVPSPDEVQKGRVDAKAKVKKSAVAHFDAHIGKELRQLYASILEEPIPKRFLDLLQSLEEEGKATLPGGDS